MAPCCWHASSNSGAEWCCTQDCWSSAACSITRQAQCRAGSRQAPAWQWRLLA